MSQSLIGYQGPENPTQCLLVKVFSFVRFHLKHGFKGQAAQGWKQDQKLPEPVAQVQVLERAVLLIFFCGLLPHNPAMTRSLCLGLSLITWNISLELFNQSVTAEISRSKMKLSISLIENGKKFIYSGLKVWGSLLQSPWEKNFDCIICHSGKSPHPAIGMNSILSLQKNN